MPGSQCSPPMMSIITEYRMCWLSADVPCKPPGPFTPNASSTAPRNPPRFPSRLDQPTRHFHNRRNESVNRNRRCLKVVDRFRGSWAVHAVPDRPFAYQARRKFSLQLRFSKAALSCYRLRHGTFTASMIRRAGPIA